MAAGVVQQLDLVLDEPRRLLTQKELQETLSKGTNPAAATKNLSAVERAVANIKHEAVKLAAQLAAVFAVHKIIEFGQEGVRQAVQQREILAGLDLQLKRVGTSYAEQRDRIAELNEQTEKQGVDDDATATILSRLVNYSDNYAASLNNVQLVADVAANKHIDFEEAAVVVGKSMAGNTALAEKYFGTFEKGSDPIEFMRQKVNGTAEALSKQRGGLDQARIAWDDLQKAIGAALLGAGEGNTVLPTLTDAIHKLTDAIADNPEAVQAFGKALILAARGGVTVMAAAMSGLTLAAGGVLRAMQHLREIDAGAAFATGDMKAGANFALQAIRLKENADALMKYSDALDHVARVAAGQDVPGAGKTVGKPSTVSTGNTGFTPKGQAEADAKAQADRISLLQRQAKFLTEAADATARLHAEEAALTAALASGTLKYGERITAEEQLATVQQTLGEIAAQEREIFANATLGALNETTGFISGIAAINPAAIVEQQSEKVITATDNVQNFVGGALSAMADQVDFIEQALVHIGEGNARAIIRDLRTAAKGHVLHDLASAASEFAHGLASSAFGNFAGASVHYKAGLAFLASAAKWGVLAGAANSLGGGVTGQGSAGAATTAGDVTGAATRTNAERTSSDLHFYFDQFDPRKPQHQDLVGEAARLYAERGGRIYVNDQLVGA